MWYWLFKYVFMGPLLSLLGRPKVEGLEHVPTSGACILASNHLAVADSFYKCLVVKRRITYLAKAEYFTGTGPKGVAQRVFFGGSGQVPIDRTNASAAEDAIRTGIRILTQGKLLGIYPEGTRSPDGRLFRGKTGIARMTLETGAPVVPVAMLYEPRRVPLPGALGRRVGKHLVRVVVRFGEPLDFSRYAGLSGDRFVERSITDEVMYEIMELSGQEYVDVYGAKVKKSMDTTGVSATEAVSRLQPQAHEVDRLPDSLAG